VVRHRWAFTVYSTNALFMATVVPISNDGDRSARACRDRTQLMGGRSSTRQMKAGVPTAQVPAAQLHWLESQPADGRFT
jgi:hypothetical protein